MPRNCWKRLYAKKRRRLSQNLLLHYRCVHLSLFETEPSQVLNLFRMNIHDNCDDFVVFTAGASLILGALSPEMQADVAKCIALMDRTSPEIIKEVERILERKLSSLSIRITQLPGVDATVAILNAVDRGTEKRIMESLEIDEPNCGKSEKMFDSKTSCFSLRNSASAA